jgi:hypothetical protein
MPSVVPLAARFGRLAIVASLVTGAFACSNSSNSSTTPTDPSSKDHGTVTATINGVAWTGTVDIARNDANGLLVEGRGAGTIFGEGDTISLDIQGTGASGTGSPATGVHSVTDVADIGQVLVATLSGTTVLHRWSAGRGSGTGNWTLDSLTSTSAVGSFGVVAPSADGLQTSVSITLGAFSATFF